MLCGRGAAGDGRARDRDEPPTRPVPGPRRRGPPSPSWAACCRYGRRRGSPQVARARRGHGGRPGACRGPLCASRGGRDRGARRLCWRSPACSPTRRSRGASTGRPGRRLPAASRRPTRSRGTSARIPPTSSDCWPVRRAARARPPPCATPPGSTTRSPGPSARAPTAGPAGRGRAGHSRGRGRAALPLRGRVRGAGDRHRAGVGRDHHPPSLAARRGDPCRCGRRRLRCRRAAV